MLINGEKWACESCVRGHRVSNCQHSDRPLQHINKKGRPVTQCQHCRTMRKARSAHSKCDCGERTHKCSHLKTTVEGHKDSCCCNHGGRCTCQHKKERLQLELAPEGATKHGLPRPRRRANTLGGDDHGHGAKSAYRVSKAYAAQRSTDRDHRPGSSGSSDIDSDTSGSCDNDLAFPEKRKTRSEATSSPLMTGLSGGFPPLDGPLGVSTGGGMSYDLFGTSAHPDLDSAAMYGSAAFSAPHVDWSLLEGLENFTSRAGDGDFAGSQPQSFDGVFDNIGVSCASGQPPTLTTATSASGEGSEMDELVSGSSFDGLVMDSGGDYRSSSDTITGIDWSQLNGPHFGGMDFSTCNYDQFKLLKAGNKFLPTPASLAGDEPLLVAAAATSTLLDAESASSAAGLWMGDYSQGLPGLTGFDDPAEAGLHAFWE